MTEFKTPTMNRRGSRITNDPELQSSIKIPASPYLQQIGYGCGVSVFTLERSPKVGFVRSPWAIKKRNRKTRDKAFNDRILFESEILSKLDHPNIIGYRGLIKTTTGDPCLAMEQLEGSLGDVIERRLDSGDTMFPASTILKVAYEAVKGLEYLHHVAHILHGDIKSYNVLVSKDFNTVKICDFGVSMPLTDTLEVDRSTKNFNYVGTESWSAPEIILEDGPVTNKCDVWSYGLVLWEMLALSPPHAESFEESDLSESLLLETINDLGNRDLNDSVEILSNQKLGTRPPLPAVNLGSEYNQVLELFYTCTTADYKVRPSAKGIVMYFKRCVYKNEK